MLLSTILLQAAGLAVWGKVAGAIGAGIAAIAAAGDTQPVMPREGILKIDMSAMTLSEQEQEMDPLASLTGNSMVPSVGIYSAIQAVNAAAEDPAVKFIYMKPDGASAGIAQLEEFRPDLFFLESAWEGKDKTWYKKNDTA